TRNLQKVKDLFTTYGQLISDQLSASRSSRLQILNKYTKLIVSLSISLEQKKKRKQPSEESAREIVWENFLSLQGKELDVRFEICNRLTREHIMKMRWNDPLLSYVVDVSKCEFLRCQFTVNEWNQIAQNPQKYNSKLDTKQIQYIQSCYEQRKSRLRIRQLMREGENQVFQEFVTEIFIILTNIWERKDLNELNEGTWEILFTTPLIELLKLNQNPGEKGSESSGLQTADGDQEILFEETSGSIKGVDEDKLIDDGLKLIRFASDAAVRRHNKILLPNERFIVNFESFCRQLEKLEIFLFHLH
ncbi:27901_t:CDS:2, partial [Dentiscutata erythropus]